MTTCLVSPERGSPYVYPVAVGRRRMYGITARELGAAIGVDHSHVIGIERGRRRLLPYLAEPWAAALGGTVEEVFPELSGGGGFDPPRP